MRRAAPRSHPKSVALAVARELFGQRAPRPAIHLVRRDRHALYRTTAGGRAIAIKLFVDVGGSAAAEAHARAAFGRQLPVPPLITQGRRDGLDYIALAWCKGTPLSDAIRRRARIPLGNAFEQAGRALGLLARSGRVAPASRRVLPRSPLVLTGRSRDRFLRDFARKVRVLGTRWGATFLARLVDAAGWYHDRCATEEPVVAHGDFQPDNLLHASDGRLVGIIDWELSTIAPRWSDLSQMLRFAATDALEERLASGYRAVHPLPRDWTRAARAYDASRIALGLAGAPAGGADEPHWRRHAEACLAYLDRGDPTHARRTGHALLSRPRA